MPATHYEVLGLDRKATSREIRTAYYRLALKYHPDKNPGNEQAQEQFIAISDAYQVLSDGARRRQYDRFIDYGLDFEPVQAKTRRRPPPPEYYRRRYQQTVEYSTKTYVYGVVFGVLLLAAVLLIPYFLLRTSSERHYDLAWNSYKRQQYVATLDNVRYAIRDFGTRNAEACLLAGIILTDHLIHYDQALRYLNLGLEHHPNDSVAASLNYFRGKCLIKMHRYDEAGEALSRVGVQLPYADSAVLTWSRILILVAEDYDAAIPVLRGAVIGNPGFDEARYYLAIAMAKLRRDEEALVEFAELVERNFEPAACFYHMSISEYRLGRQEDACRHLEAAMSLNLKEAAELHRELCAPPP